MNSKTGHCQNHEISDRAEPTTIKQSDSNIYVERSKTNGWYNAPLYKDMEDLGDDQIVIRMNYLKFQVHILEEAAEFEVREVERTSLLVTISKYRAERDALGMHLSRRIVKGDLSEAEELTQHHVDYWKNREAQLRINPHSASGLDVRTGKHRSPKKPKSVSQIRGAASRWNGIERRRTASIAIAIPTSPNSNRKNRGKPQSIMDFVKF